MSNVTKDMHELYTENQTLQKNFSNETYISIGILNIVKVSHKFSISSIKFVSKSQQIFLGNNKLNLKFIGKVKRSGIFKRIMKKKSEVGRFIP